MRGSELADAPDPPADRGRYGPSPVGALRRWRHRRGLGAAEHLATRIAAALQPCLRLAEIDRAQQQAGRRAQPARPDAAGHARRSVARCGGQCARPRPAGRARLMRDPSHALATGARRLGAASSASSIISPRTPLEERALQRGSGAQGTGPRRAMRRRLPCSATPSPCSTTSRRRTWSSAGRSRSTAARRRAWSRSGWIDVYKGDADSAIERFKIALDLAPHDSLAFNSLVGHRLRAFPRRPLSRGRPLAGARACSRIPRPVWVHRTLCPAYVFGGAGAEAQSQPGCLRERLSGPHGLGGAARLAAAAANLQQSDCRGAARRGARRVEANHLDVILSGSILARSKRR